MENERVLGGLFRKRAEVAARLAEARAEAERLAAALENVEATIRMFGPEIAMPRLRSTATPHRHAAYHGEISRPIYDALRGAAEAITTRELTLRVMAARALDTTDKAFVRSMQKRVNASLRQMRLRGAARSDRRNGGELGWRLA